MPVLIRTFLFLFALIFIGSMCANSADAQLVRASIATLAFTAVPATIVELR